MYTDDTKFTQAQLSIVNELCRTHGLQPDQISFEKDELTPIFDYEAVCALSLSLTDIVSVECRMLAPTSEPLGTGSVRISNAECTVRLPDGRTRTCVDSAQLGETVAGRVVDTPRAADSLAQNRAVRRGIRSVGVNLYNAHRKYMESGDIAAGHTNDDPRLPDYKEIHALAEEVDLIVNGNKSAYRQLMAELYGGIETLVDLNDIELRQFLKVLRAMAGNKRYHTSKTAA